MHSAQYRIRCGISEEAQRWWLEHIKHIMEFCAQENPITSHVWPLNQLAEQVAMSTQPGPPNEPSISSINIEESQLPPHIQRVYQKEHGPHPPVSHHHDQTHANHSFIIIYCLYVCRFMLVIDRE